MALACAHSLYRYFRRVTQLQPGAAQGWLEFCRMEDECGNIQRCQSILRQGLLCCAFNEVCGRVGM